MCPLVFKFDTNCKLQRIQYRAKNPKARDGRNTTCSEGFSLMMNDEW